MLEIILVKTLCLNRKGTCPEAITLFTGDLSAQNVFALPFSIAHLASPRQPKEGRCIKILPCKPGNLKEQKNILYMSVVGAVIAPGVAVKGQGSSAHAARAEHCSGAPSHLPSTQLECSWCPRVCRVSSKLALLRQPGITTAGIFSQERVLCSEIDFWHTFVGHYWNHL